MSAPQTAREAATGAAVGVKGKLPLHIAAGVGAPLDVVVALLAAHPAGAAATDKKGRLPLHDAAAEKAPLEVVAALLAAHPGGVAVTDKDGKLPLDLALKMQVIDELRLARDNAKTGSTPLHRTLQRKDSAAKYDAFAPEVKALVTADASLAMLATTQGSPRSKRRSGRAVRP
ncbi:hypothetical protein FOA52_002437 [Chlamydomonas sp. UWO 241]|nr:hypothetical protein FOA52_002437 [Chlamydomonas sp. UWO 241]